MLIVVLLFIFIMLLHRQQPSRSHEAADAGNSCGEVQQEGQQSQQQNEEETEEGEIIIRKYNWNKSW